MMISRADALPLPKGLSDDARHVWPGLGPAWPAPACPVLVVLTGPPGTGKTTFARRLVALAPIATISNDHVRKLLVVSPQYTRKEDRRVFHVVRELTAALLRSRVSVIRDGVNPSERARQGWVDLARGLGARPVVVELRASPETVRRRLAIRSGPDRDPFDYSDARWGHYLRFRSFYEPVSPPHVVVDSEGDYQFHLDALAALMG